MSEERFAGSPDLWLTSLPLDRGPEKNLELWVMAESMLDGMCKPFEYGPDHFEAVHTALVDAYNRCIEERRRAEDLLRLHQAWRERGIGGVVEPESPVRPPGQ